MKDIIPLIIAYLLGSISFSYLFTKWIKKVDIREFGSGNAGATNTLRVLGIGPAIAVLVLDILKGVLAVVIAMMVTDNSLIHALSGLFVICGHNWPVFHGFRGGKGVATTIGVLATLMFIPTLIGTVVAIVAIAITRYVSLGSLLLMVTTAIFSFVFLHTYDYSLYYTYLAVIAAILSFWKHRANIQRLLKGEENKLGKRKAE